jgi:exopolyphosphatase/pppGpp-phosphohydrolase
LPPARADIIVAGAAILAEAMRFFGAPSVVVSVRGVRYGALVIGAGEGV